jgi:23S rRNA pseudouridine2605 synthase
MLQRIQKIIASAGIASRRKAEQLMASGQVAVNGQVVTELGSKADPDVDHIRVAGKLLHGPQRPVYLLMNKPKGYVTTVSDPQGRPTVLDLARGLGSRVYPVGRLDYASEGLLLLTNDGELAHRLTRAASHVPKTYHVKVSGRPSLETIARLRTGVILREKGGKPVKTAPARINLLRDAPNPWYEVTLVEGRNRQIRRMFKEVKHDVEKIKRVRYGPLALDVEPGRFRALRAVEVEKLRKSAASPGAQVAQDGHRRRRRPT